MIIYKRLLGFVVSFLLSSLLLVTFYYPEKMIYFIAFSVFLLLFYFWSIKNRFVTYSLLIKYFLIVLTFLSFVWLFFVVIDSLLIKYLVASLVFIYLFIVLDSFFKKVYTNKDITQSLVVYIDLVCFWFLVYFLFYSSVLFRMNSLWASLILLFSIIILLIIRFNWQKIDFKKNISYVFTLIIILVEVYIITSFLALNFYSSAFLLWLWYYLLSDFFVDQINEKFIWNKKKKLIFLILLLFIFYLISVR
jgi:hypothetical protein